MAYTQKIIFYKVRNFSEKLNATIEFIRQNILSLGKAILYIMGPLAIINGLLFSQYINFMFSSMSNTDPVALQNPFEVVFNSTYTGFMILSVFAGLLNFSIIFNFMKIYEKTYPRPVTVSEILNASWRDILPLLLLFIIAGTLVFLGFFALLIPGVYLLIVLSLALPTWFFERKGVLESVGRSFRLIKGKWWSTFGLMFVSNILTYAVTILFVLPFYVFYFISMFTLVEETGVTADVTAWWFQGGMILSVIFMILGSFLSYTIPIVALCFQYFNLVERQESPGLLSEIDRIDAGEN